MTELTTQSILFSFLLIGSINLMAAMSPGPDFAILVKTALTNSRSKTILTALGIALGIIVHVTYCMLGIAIIISKSILLFNLVKYLGAAYFIYLGLKGLFSKTEKPINFDDANKDTVSSWGAFKVGFMCNVLNPKATLFFLGLFTLVIHPQTPVWVQMLYGLEMCLITFLWFSILGFVITHKQVKKKLNDFQHYVTRLMGGLLMLFGIEIALMDK